MRNRERATHMLYNMYEDSQRERGGGKKTLLERERQEKLREREREREREFLESHLTRLVPFLSQMVW